MKIKTYCILVSIAVLLSSGCTEKVALSVTNGLEHYNINCVYISRNSDHVWGANHLPGTDILEPGKTAEVLVRPGSYDLQVTDEDGDTYTLNDIRVGVDGFNWTVNLDHMDAMSSSDTDIEYAGQIPIVITNDLGDWDIYGIWISSSVDEEWGNNHIEDATLYPGDTYTAYVQSGTYDIYIEDQDGDTYSRYSIIVADEGYTWSISLSDLDSSSR